MARKNLLKGFKTKGTNFEHDTVEANYGKFVAYPLNVDLEQLLETRSEEFFYLQSGLCSYCC